ncbi:hypothetical protein H4P12_07005 [Paracoccus sp. 11-3]|uniref:Uncharacterized protein n=1 Tax=Paracoccus amoyensis TaxID=2760093 RepID=A0A926GFN8_9RHOB|nr:hypothetical protein [Paracoccus amoyensis]MBC9246464.1 hypothetical protein [Paracoccus amoyensis]
MVDVSEQKPTQGRHLLVACVLIALEVWPVGFNLGAYGTVFWSDLFEIWVVSMVTLLAGLYLIQTSATRPPIHGMDLVAMLLPSLWFVSQAIDRIYPAGPLSAVQTVLEILTVIFALPIVIGVVMRVTMPETLQLRGLRQNAVLIAITLAVCGGSYLIGIRNDLLFTCEDFKVSGDDPPANCFNPPQ